MVCLGFFFFEGGIEVYLLVFYSPPGECPVASLGWRVRYQNSLVLVTGLDSWCVWGWGGGGEGGEATLILHGLPSPGSGLLLCPFPVSHGTFANYRL